MRVCLVSPYDLARQGGVNKHIFCLARSLRALGDEVEVIGPASGPVAGNQDPVLPVSTFTGVVSIQSNASDNRIGLWASPRAVREALLRRAYDVVHIHEPLVPAVALYALWFTQAPARVCTFHCYSEAESPLVRLSRKALRPHLSGFQRGIAVSQAAAQYARVVWDRPLSIIPNGVDASFLSPARSSPSSSPSRSAAHDSPLRLLFIGQFTDQRKGLAVLMDAYRRLRREGMAVTLDIVGQGDPRVPLPYTPPGVTFLGRVSELELRQRLRDCDIFVAPSLGGESFGMVLVEAMAVGKPVVCSDIDGYRDVANLRGARLFPAQDAAALAQVLSALGADPAQRRAMGQFNRSEALRYDWPQLALRVRSEYEAALDWAPSYRTASARSSESVSPVLRMASSKR